MWHTRCEQRHFNPRPPRGGRLCCKKPLACSNDFNPRPPRGGRLISFEGPLQCYTFQSTPPARGATAWWPGICPISWKISIHAPREGGDLISRTLEPEIGNFNPRPPRGGRRTGDAHANRDVWNFNPRPPRGGRPPSQGITTIRWIFQSTPPARGATSTNPRSVRPSADFNPRPPRGGRQQRCTVLPADL